MALSRTGHASRSDAVYLTSERDGLALRSGMLGRVRSGQGDLVQNGGCPEFHPALASDLALETSKLHPVEVLSQGVRN